MSLKKVSQYVESIILQILWNFKHIYTFMEKKSQFYQFLKAIYDSKNFTSQKWMSYNSSYTLFAQYFRMDVGLWKVYVCSASY